VRRTVVVFVLAAALLPTAATAQTACPPPGGEPPAPAQPAPGEFSITGHGWGHGVGMSQFGARGAARLGCTAGQILGTYYPGVEIAGAPTGSTDIRVGLWPDRPRANGGSPAEALNVVTLDQVVGWRYVGPDGAVVPVPDQPVETTWTVRIRPDGTMVVSNDAAGTVVWGPGGSRGGRLEVLHDGKRIVLTSKANREYRRGTLEIASVDYDGIPRLRAVMAFASLEQYLYGLAEMPSSWEVEALKTQAIAGRSYALYYRERRSGQNVATNPDPWSGMDLFDTVWSQVYAGHAKEVEVGGAWRQAVDGTAGSILRHDGATVVGFYSSSHGGYSTTARIGFGGSLDLPYLRPIDDSRWDAASGNPYRSWTVAFTADDLGRRLGVGRATRVTVLAPLAEGGRVGSPDQGFGGVRVEGTVGSPRTMSGITFRSLTGIRSTRFLVHQNVGPGPCDPTRDQSGNTRVLRVAGPQRVDTAVAVSAANWQTSGHALLATAGAFPDALAAGALAAKLDAPLLLTPGDRLPANVLAELGRLQAETVWILGGTAAISGAVEQEVADAGFEIRRLAGPSRTETAREIALAPAGETATAVSLVLGDTWPDAVASGALAASPARLPTLLTGRNAIPAATLEALTDLQTTTVYVVGGTAVVSDAVVADLAGRGFEVVRLSGPNRFATSVAVAEQAAALGDQEPRPLVLASGEAFPDALSAGALAARLGGSLLLVPQCNLDGVPVVSAFLDNVGTATTTGVIVGGVAAVSDRTREQATASLGG
jgi:peptidoglycan hydrolase-like amidase